MASNEAKVVFRAETADFQAQIKSANSEISSLRAELKLNEAQFKNTGDESSYYETKLALLDQELEANRQKQEALRSEIEVAKSVYGENSAEVAKLETSLTYAQIQEENLRGQVNDTVEAMSTQKDATDEASVGVDDMAQALAGAGIADMVGEIADAAYDLAQEFGEATAAIVEGTGTSGEALEDLSDAAVDAFSSIADADITIGDVSSALAEINTRFGLTGDAAEEMTEAIVNFANHTDTDAVGAVDSIADVVARWGMDVDDVDGLLDDLTTASQSCSLSVDDLSGYLSSNSAQFAELGYSTEDALALLVGLANGGAKTSTVMSGMTKAVSNLSEVTDDVPGAFQTAIDAIGECDSVAEALQAEVGDTGLTIEDVFGTKAAQELATSIQNGNFEIGEWTAALETNDGALDDTTESATTMADEWAQASNDISTTLSSVFTPAVTAAVTALAGIVSNVAQTVQDSPALQAVLAGVATAFGVLAAAMAIAGVINALRTAFALLNTTMRANVIVLIVSAIAALVSALVYAYNNSEEFRAVVDAAFEAVKNAISTAVETARSVLAKMGEAVQSVAETVAALPETVRTKLAELVLTFAEKFSAAKEAVAEKMSAIVSGITGKIAAVKAAIRNKLESIVELFSSKFEAAKETVSDAIETIKGFFDFEWSLPSIKLPHFSIDGEFSLSPLSTPTISVEWYKSGGIVTGASLVGVGEAGAEAIVPLESRRYAQPFVDMIAESVGGGSTTNVYIDGVQAAPDSKLYALADSIVSEMQTVNRRRGVR